MMNRPKEKYQVNMVMKGLLPVYYNRMFASPIMDFEQLCNSEMRIENSVDNGQLDKRGGRISVTPEKTFRSSSKTPNIQANINVVQPNQYQYQCPPQHQYQNAYPNPSRQGPKLKRHFDPLGTPLSKVFEHMCKRGHLKPLDLTPYPDPLLKNWNMNLYCLFHQKTGHSTNECTRLKHEIQDLIDNDVIPKPRLTNQPNMYQNPLLNYQRTPPPNQINFIEVRQEDWMLAIDDEARDDLEEEAHNTSWYVEDITEIEEARCLTRGGRHFKPTYLEEDYLR
jgi:hypothetical protein